MHEPWRIAMERREFLKSAAAMGLAAGTSGAGVAAAAVAEAQTGLGGVNLADAQAALAQFRKTIPANFDRIYVENVIVTFFLTSLYEGERPLLPMIDLNFTKEMALPYHLWGMLYEDWKPAPDEGVTVFLQGLEKRGENN